MCRNTKPPAIFFMPSTATLAEFEFLPPPVPLPLCPIYSTLKSVVIPPLLKPNIRRTGLEFVLSPDGVRFTDVTFVNEVKNRVAQLMASASDFNTSSNNVRLAKKTLKFRNIMQYEQPSDTAISVL